MKLQLDTINKTVKFESSLKFSELEDTLKKLLPEDYREYKIEVNTTINWTYPHIIYRDYPYWRPWSLTTSNTDLGNLYNPLNADSNYFANTSSNTLNRGGMTVDFGTTEMKDLTNEGVYNIEL